MKSPRPALQRRARRGHKRHTDFCVNRRHIGSCAIKAPQGRQELGWHPLRYVRECLASHSRVATLRIKRGGSRCLNPRDAARHRIIILVQPLTLCPETCWRQFMIRLFGSPFFTRWLEFVLGRQMLPRRQRRLLCANSGLASTPRMYILERIFAGLRRKTAAGLQ